MSWSGGTYTKGNNATGGWAGDASLGIGIEAGRHDTQDNDFATGINNCIAKDGQNAATADLPMGAFKHTNVANATARNNYAAVGQVQDGDFIWLGTAGGTTTALTASASPAITAYKAGQKFRLITASGSTGSTATAHTLTINGVTPAKNIVNNEDSTNPTLGTWVAGALMELVYDGTNFRITNDPGGWLTYTPTFTPSAGSLSNTSLKRASYRKRGKIIELNVAYNFDTTSVGSYIEVSVPIDISTANVQDLVFIVRTLQGGSNNAGIAINDAQTKFKIYATTTIANWGTQTGSQIRLVLSYPSV